MTKPSPWSEGLNTSQHMNLEPSQNLETTGAGSCLLLPLYSLLIACLGMSLSIPHICMPSLLSQEIWNKHDPMHPRLRVVNGVSPLNCAHGLLDVCQNYLPKIWWTCFDWIPPPLPTKKKKTYNWNAQSCEECCMFERECVFHINNKLRSIKWRTQGYL